MVELGSQGPSWYVKKAPSDDPFEYEVKYEKGINSYVFLSVPLLVVIHISSYWVMPSPQLLSLSLYLKYLSCPCNIRYDATK